MEKDIDILNSYDEEYYDTAINEIKSGQFSQSLWSKALAKSDFDESKAKSAYVELRVDQLKNNDLIEAATDEINAETSQIKKENEARQEELIQLEKETRKLENQVKDQKRELIFQNILYNPLFMIQGLIIASAAGFYKESWVIFGVVLVGLIVVMAIPILSAFVGFVLAGLFGLSGYVLANEWWGETAGYWTGGITFLVVLGANFELLGKNKEVKDL